MSLPPFTLYGIMGCPHCEAAEKFLKIRNMTYVAMWADGDPIIDAGVKQVLGIQTAEYPILISRITKSGKISIVKGFKKETYEKLADTFYSLANASISSIFGARQQSQPEALQAAPPKPNGKSDDSIDIVDDILEVGDTLEVQNPTTKTGKGPKGPRVI